MGSIPQQFTGVDWTFTIPSGESVSNGRRIDAYAPRGLQVEIPAAWTAADVALEVSDDDLTYGPLRDSTAAKVKLTNVPTTSTDHSKHEFPSTAWGIGSWKYVRLASVSTSDENTYVNQGAARTFVGKPMS